MHKPIQFQNVSLAFPQKVCFEGFSAQVACGSRIAIIGRNGAGKSMLLKLLLGVSEASQGGIRVPEDVIIGYVPQVVEEFVSLSGGQRFNKALTDALALSPNVLLLDEPTNHLDLGNRKSLMRMLRSYSGTLIIVSHDLELLNNAIDTLWHIDNERIHVFSGNYEDYMREIGIKRTSIEQELSRLSRQKKETHEALMKEQERSAKSKERGEKKRAQGHWSKIVAGSKERQAEVAAGRNKSQIQTKKQELAEKLSELRLPEVIKPKFSLSAADIGQRTLVSVSEGTIGYEDKTERPILMSIEFSLDSHERIAIAGDNGSGKSTFIKAILSDPSVTKSGSWRVPKTEDIGYLDQHYGTLASDKTVLEVIHDLVPSWTHADVRKHLNDFLFRKNEEVNEPVSKLSGGEKARLSLAQIAAKTPKLILLDEITNNIDLETRNHVVQILQEYPGAMIVVSHDENFLQAIRVTKRYDIVDGGLRM